MSTDQELQDSMSREYWEDFNAENKLISDKKKLKFIPLDDTFVASTTQLNKDLEKMFKQFNPDRPPVLENYDELAKDYKLPSRQIFEREKTAYREHIRNLRKV